MKKHEKYYIQEFIRIFVKVKSQKEWLNYALSPDIDNLSELSAWDFWDENKTDQSMCIEWKNNVQSLKNEVFIKDILNRICVVLKLGHDQVSIEEHMLLEVLNGEIYIFEGIVIIDPQNLALVFNHDSEIAICRRGL